MSFKAFLEELGQLIHHRSVISCVYPKLVALETVQELTKLNCAYPGLITTSGAAVKEHLNRYQHPSMLFVTEYLEDGSGLDLIRELHQAPSDHRCVLIVTHNHALAHDTLSDPTISGIVLDQNIGTPGCVLTQALQAVNRDGRYVDPNLNRTEFDPITAKDALSSRELEVLGLVAEGLSNREVAERLFLAPTTVRDHVQSLMRKLRTKSRTGAAVAGLRLGLLMN